MQKHVAKAHIAVIAASVACIARAASAQQPDEEPAVQAETDEPGFSLESVSPNPFPGETRISFRLQPELLAREESVRVSLRVFNILRQLVAVPVLVQGGGFDGDPLEELEFVRPGLYVAYWDGLDQDGHPATAGPYFVELRVGERSQVRKILLIR